MLAGCCRAGGGHGAHPARTSRSRAVAYGGHGGVGRGWGLPRALQQLPWLLGGSSGLWGHRPGCIRSSPDALGIIYGEKHQEKLRLLLYRLVQGLFSPPVFSWSGGVS